MSEQIKKNNHVKLKVISGIIVLAVVFLLGIYVGTLLQKNYYGFLFSINHNAFTIVFWLILIVVAIIAIAVLYFMYKRNSKNKN